MTTETKTRRLPIRMLATLALAGSTALICWRLTSLDGLPDIGEPFDVAAFADREVPDPENAYVLYKEAVALLKEEPPNSTYDWATAGEAERRWLEANRPAMEIWKRGTERPNALYVAPRSMKIDTQLVVVQELRALGRLARLEASRLEAEGDLEGAWRWHRAHFRSSRHVGLRATIIERLVGISFHSAAVRDLNRWASDPRVDAAMLRRALDAAIADDAMTGPLSDNFKVDYLLFVNSCDDPDLMLRFLVDDSYTTIAKSSPFGRFPVAFRFQRILLKEPERSRRVVRLMMADALAWSDVPRRRRPPIAASIPNPLQPGKVNFELWGGRTDSTRALPPADLVAWFESTLFARHLFFAFSPCDVAVARERSTQANLLLALANRLYELEHGQPAKSVEELVGPYLKAIPEGLPTTSDTTDARNQP